MVNRLPSASELMGLMYTAPERLSELCITARAWYTAVYYAGGFG